MILQKNYTDTFLLTLTYIQHTPLVKIYQLLSDEQAVALQGLYTTQTAVYLKISEQHQRIARSA